MNIVVLAGGLSMERNVSLVSGAGICASLRRSGNRAVLMDLFYGTAAPDWSCDLDTVFEQLPPIPNYAIDTQEPDLQAIKRSRAQGGESLFGPGVLELCRRADMVFLGLHGASGEDGRVQAAFDLMGIAYTGSDYTGSAIAMSKIYTKIIAQHAGVQTPAWSVVKRGEDLEVALSSMPVPAVAKIPCGGSSIGVTICRTREELHAAAEHYLEEHEELLLEEFVAGREFSCGVLGKQALPAVEIIPNSAFFDYNSKYQPNASVERCPAELEAEHEMQMRSMAYTMHEALGLSVYSRSDFLLSENGNLYFLETNTLPGMTPASLLPKEAAAAGIDYDELCQTIVTLSAQLRGRSGC